ncbi:FxSxx-COOH system tetratricopeptide repeat protein [Phytohabitans kaempferiae]|uniref:FxSxx-COOH system tetratricopeptide repeat protein n=1 Tax=Phytohabitans kaempferiae TaxID=1620943 RepID=A0ABV6LZN9_9ACTN
MTESNGGTIVTFYSYKGGTGRTMALANVAWILASQGKRVLAVDWDLESPGLHKYYHPFLLDKHLRTSPGVIDMIRDYATAMMQPIHDSETTEWLASHADVLRYAVSLDWQFPDKGFLDFLPAGQQDSSYTRIVSTFDWSAFYERMAGNTFLDALRRNMRENYDYVLIDSRTGVSDSGGICTVRLPDVVVDCFTMNAQSIDGALSVAKSINRQRADRPVRLLPVPMRVEDAEQVKLEAGRDYARQSFAPFLGRRSAEDVNEYWGDVEIPYKPFYAYEEILSAFGDRSRQENSLLAAYERLANVITEGEVQQLAPLDERVRRRWLAAFERRRPAGTSDVFISYTAVDRMWAEWISGELDDAGLRVAMREVDFPAESDSGGDVSAILADATRAIVLLSQDYVQSPNAADLWKLVASRDPVSGTPFLVPVRLDNVRVGPPFHDRVPVDFAGLTEQRATEVLLEALDQPIYPRPTTSPAGEEGQTPRRRFPALEPPLWSVPQRNGTFTGRRRTLEALRNRLSATGTAVVPQALHGLGGVGKTQIALEYAHRFRADYDVVWWVSAQLTSVVRSSLASLADQLGLPTGDSVTERVRAGLEALRQGRPYRRWLLIFDNADDPAQLREYLPQGPGHVLITTRDQAWAREAHVVEVGVFTREESIAFLHRRIPHLSDTDAELVAERLGDLPLAIEQAGAWLAATAMPVAHYLELLETQPLKMLEEELPPDYRSSSAQPWLVSLDSLRQRSPAAAKLLEICAFFAPEPIPVSLVYSDRFIEALLPYDPSLRERMLVGRAMREISRYALARVDSGRPGPTSSVRRRIADRGDDGGGQSIQLHRLMQTIIRATLTPEQRAENQHQVHEILAAANPGDADNAEHWPVYADLWPHLIRSGVLDSDSPHVRQLVLDMGRYLWKISDYPTAQAFAERAITQWDRTHGPDDQPTLMMRYNLACALRLQADYTAAYAIDDDVYGRLTRTAGDDHPYTLMAGGGLAADLRALGQLARARDLDEQIESRWREAFGEEHPRTLTAGHNLAISLRLAGDLRSALILQERTLQRRRAVHGELHPWTLYSAGNYGRDLRDTGDLRESRRVLETALNGHRRVLGEDHPESLRAAKNFAVTLRKLGEFEQAYALSADTLARSLRVHGPQHPDSLACSINLASDESALGQDLSARRRATPVYEWYRSTMGEDHAFTLAYGNNLAIFMRKAGDLAAARELTSMVVERFTATVGPDHPYTLVAAVNLGDELFQSGDFGGARASDEQAYPRIRQVLGAEHPDTLAAGSNLAISRRADGDRPGANALMESLMASYRRVLGNDHPNTVAAANWSRLSCDLEPPPT